MQVVVVLCIAVVFSSCDTVAAKAYSLPKSLILCPRNDDVCLAKAIQAAIPLVTGGIPKLGVLPVDPLHVTELSIDQGQGPVSIKLSFKNQDITGIKDAVVTYAKGEIDDKKFRLEAHTTLPTLTLMGDYVINGKVLILPVQGAGRNNLTLSDFATTLVFTGHVIERDNEQYVEMDDLVFHFKTSRLHIGLENLFNGDKRLGENMLVFLNENWEGILKELQEPIEEAFEVVFMNIVRRIYSKIPYKKIHLF